MESDASKRGRSNRNRGAAFERKIAKMLTDELGFVVRRNASQARGGAIEGPDIQVGHFGIECKSRDAIAVYPWLEKAEIDSVGSVPVVVARADGKVPIVIMYLDDFLPMLRGEL